MATDQYPGPPIDGEARQLGSTRLPSYDRAHRNLNRANRTPPPEYKNDNRGSYFTSLFFVDFRP